MTTDNTNPTNIAPIEGLSLKDGTPLPRIDREGTVAQFDLAEKVGQLATTTEPVVEYDTPTTTTTPREFNVDTYPSTTSTTIPQTQNLVPSTLLPTTNPSVLTIPNTPTETK